MDDFFIADVKRQIGRFEAREAQIAQQDAALNQELNTIGAKKAALTLYVEGKAPVRQAKRSYTVPATRLPRGVAQAAALDVLRENGRARVRDIVSAIRARGLGTTTERTCAVLSHMRVKGIVRRVQHGVYELAA